MSDRRLDPVTADFVDGSAGGFESCDDIENQVAFSLLVPLGSWEGDPLLGHRLGELDRATNTVENRNRLRSIVLDAVAWLVDLGKLARVEVTVESHSATAAAYQLDYYTPGDNSPRKAGPFLVPLGAA